MAEAKKVVVSDECIGCGTCTAHHVQEGDAETPLFDVIDGKSEFVYKGEMTDEVISAVEEASDDCPVGAISIE